MRTGGHRLTRLPVVLAVAAALTAAGCSTTPGAEPSAPASSAASGSPSAGATRPLSADEADRLAVARFTNYDRGVVPIELSVPTATGQVLSLRGRADLRRHRGLAAFATDDTAPSHGVLAWDLDELALLPTDTPVPAADLDATTTRTGWRTQPARPGDPLAAALVITLNLAADRPDNAQLLRQNGAQWQGETVLDGTAVTQMTATAPGEGQRVSYYVDDRGGLLRADVDTGLGRPASIRFLAGEAAALPRVPALRADQE